MNIFEYSREEYKLIKASGIVLATLRSSAGFENISKFSSHIGMERSQYGRYECGQNMEMVSIHRLLSHHDVRLDQYYKMVYKELCIRK